MSIGEYSLEDDDQLQPEDTLIDRGVDDVLDEGFSPPERLYGRGSFGTSRESLDQLLAEEEQDPASRINIRSTRMSSNAPTRPNGKPSFRSEVRLDVRVQVDLWRRTGDLAKTQRQSSLLRTSVSAEAQPLRRRPQFTSSRTPSNDRACGFNATDIQPLTGTFIPAVVQPESYAEASVPQCDWHAHAPSIRAAGSSVTTGIGRGDIWP
jgi:hypothetical protein